MENLNQKTVIGNVCFIQDKQSGKVLLLKRAKEPMQSMYTGVGGKANFDEDMNASCIREVKEETGLDVNVKLKGVVKTILDGYNSAWILFVYTADDFKGEMINCNEGDLEWVDANDIYSRDLIGFIKRILPNVLNEKGFVEGIIKHDIKGNIIEERLIESA